MKKTLIISVLFFFSCNPLFFLLSCNDSKTNTLGGKRDSVVTHTKIDTVMIIRKCDTDKKYWYFYEIITNDGSVPERGTFSSSNIYHPGDYIRMEDDDKNEVIGEVKSEGKPLKN